MAVPFGRDRILMAGLAACLLAAVVVARLAFVQIVSYPHFSARAEQNQQGRVLLPPRRGDVLDRNGRTLAGDLRTYSVYAVPRLMKDRRATARTLARLLDLDARKLEKRFRDRPAFCWVTRQANPGIEEQLERARLRGVYLTVETRRQQPGGEAVLPIVGRVNLDGRGVEAIEYQFDAMLRGKPGWATVFKDGTGKQMTLPAGRSREPEHGHGLALTIDADMQEIVVARLRAAADSLRAKQTAAVIVDPATGQILAMAAAGPGAPGAQRNPIISDQYEPGSTFKSVVAAAILEERLADPKTIYDAGRGERDFGGFVIHDSHPYDRLTLRDAIRYSSNVVCGQLAMQVGPRRYYEYASAFGFGALTGVEFPGEVGGRLRPPRLWSKRSLPTLAIGQEVAVTPLQMALAYAAIANGGVLLRPQLVLAELDEKGRIERRFEPKAVRRVIAPSTAATMRDFLQSVVDSGTAKRAALPWTTVAGKTGTAQKYDPSTKTYSRDRYIGSFVGFLPADDPRLVCLVLVDEPRRGYYGGEVAAPVFRDIMEEIRRLRGGPLSPRPATVQLAAARPRLPQTLVPDVRLLPRERAEERLADLGLRAVMEGKGARVLEQVPPPGSPAERGQTVRLIASRDAAATVPDVRGRTVREALALLSARAMPVRVTGSGRVVSQTPGPGAPLPKGEVCVLVCRHDVSAAGRAGEPALLARAGDGSHGER